MKICMFVLNSCTTDSRVLKEARTLTEAGHDVRIIAVLDGGTEPYEERDGFRIIRVVRNPLHHRASQALLRARCFMRGLFSAPSRRVPHGVAPTAHSTAGTDKEPVAVSSTEAESLRRRAYLRMRQGLVLALSSASRPVIRPLVVLDYYQRSWQAIKDEPADVYHSHDLTTLPAGYLAKRRNGGKLVYDSHELFTELHYLSRAERMLSRALETRLIRRADAVIIPNEFAARVLADRYGIGLPAVVRNCPPLARRGGEQCGVPLRGTLGLDETVALIVHVGILSRARGSEKLIEAAAFLDRGIVVFLGWGAEEAETKAFVKQRGLEDRVLFVPPVGPEQVVDYIASAQLGVVLFRNVSLNHYYATPNKLWECMNAGLPVVSSNFPALKAIVEGYDMGCTCDPEYPRDIANAINYVLSDQDRYEEMKRNALEAAKRFNWENESRRLLEVYGKLSQPGDAKAE